ncbi:hypothetical protein LXL04_033248 [Taraxacum kok-saghyz]
MSKSIFIVEQPTVNLVYLVALLCLSCLWDYEQVSSLQLGAWIYIWMMHWDYNCRFMGTYEELDMFGYLVGLINQLTQMKTFCKILNTYKVLTMHIWLQKPSCKCGKRGCEE